MARKTHNLLSRDFKEFVETVGYIGLPPTVNDLLLPWSGLFISPRVSTTRWWASGKQRRQSNTLQQELQSLANITLLPAPGDDIQFQIASVDQFLAAAPTSASLQVL